MLFNYFETTKINWQITWRSKIFRYKLFIGLFCITIILICFPSFFQYIEKRNGILLNDYILNFLPAINVSVAIFLLIWSAAFLMLISAINDPETLLTFLIAYIFLCICRYCTIFLFPLQPPTHLINLVDPLSNSFYGVKFITKDLFFSGHVSTLFLMFLCQRNKTYKVFILCATIIVLILILIQHIHYSIDVIFAFPFSTLCFFASKKLI